jgi:hypothetical protein
MYSSCTFCKWPPPPCTTIKKIINKWGMETLLNWFYAFSPFNLPQWLHPLWSSLSECFWDLFLNEIKKLTVYAIITKYIPNNCLVFSYKF